MARLLTVLVILASTCRASVVRGWVSSGRANSTDSVTVHLSLQSTTTSELHARFLAVSDPVSPQYGKYLSQEELRGFCEQGVRGSAPVVQAWLHNQGVTSEVVGCGDMLRVTASASAIESLFEVELSSFVHPSTKLALIRTMAEPSVPPHVAEHISFVSGLFTFPDVNSARLGEASSSTQVTAAKLKALYGLGNHSFSGKSNASQAVVEFQGQTVNPDDLTKFEQQNDLPKQGIRTCTGGCTGMAGDESSLDLQFIIAAGTGVPTDYHYSEKFDIVAWATWMQSTPNLALVWSVSYGEGINGGIGGHIKVAYAQGLNSQFEKLALLGVSVLIASGDSGVYSRVPWSGYIGDFKPSFPACLPAVTAVGATQLEKDGSETTGVAWSGGGFSPSEYFTRTNATWQQAAVAAYLSSTSVKFPSQNKWDRNGRGIPDVSAVGVDFQVVTDGSTTGVSGTSASCPSVAGIFALLNDARMSASPPLPPLGFLNPFIYSNMDAFNDITKGTNNGGGIKGLILPGFEATTGWDPVTGVGTPNYPKLLKAALAR